MFYVISVAGGGCFLRKTEKMKMPERWRALPRRALLVSILAQKLSKDVKTSCHDVTWRHMTSWCHNWCHTSSQNGSVQFIQVTPSKSPKITFINMVTLTFDLWPWPSNSSEIWWSLLCVQNVSSIGRTVQPAELKQTQKHTQTDATENITSLAIAGGGVRTNFGGGG